MIGRAALSLALGLLFATNAGAQLASQTALVGTVTDSGNLVIPGAQVVAVNVGTKDTYEATTNAEGYYNIQFVRTGKYEITVTVAGFQTFKASGRGGREQPGRPNERRSEGRRHHRIGERRSRGDCADHGQRGRIPDDRNARGRGPAAHWP